MVKKRKLLTLANEELLLYKALLTGTERDRAISQSGLTKYDVMGIVYKIDRELDRRKKEVSEYEKACQFIKCQEHNKKMANRTSKIKKGDDHARHDDSGS